MTAPVTFANLTAPSMALLDQMFAAVAAFAPVPCSAAGTNTITLTPLSDSIAVPTTFGTLQMAIFEAPATTTGLATAGFAGGSQFPLYKTGGTQCGSGDIVSGNVYLVAFAPTLGGLYVIGK